MNTELQIPVLPGADLAALEHMARGLGMVVGIDHNRLVLRKESDEQPEPPEAA